MFESQNKVSFAPKEDHEMGTIFGFMKNLGKTKLGDAGRSLTEAIVSWDPEAASQAEIETMIEDLDKITREAANARQTFQKEKQQADAAQGELRPASSGSGNPQPKNGNSQGRR